jgi:hypothetical protein
MEFSDFVETYFKNSSNFDSFMMTTLHGLCLSKGEDSLQLYNFNTQKVDNVRIKLVIERNPPDSEV